jgi:hypothetical protein
MAGFGAMMLFGLSAWALMPVSSQVDSPTPPDTDSRLVPAVASFNPTTHLHPDTTPHSLRSSVPKANAAVLADQENRRDAELLAQISKSQQALRQRKAAESKQLEDTVDVTPAASSIKEMKAPPPKEKVIRSIADLQRLSAGHSEVQVAEERLGKAVAEAGDAKDQKTAACTLQQEVERAEAANVKRSAPMMKKALFLLNLMASAVQNTPATADPMHAQMNAIFAADYAMPDMDLCDLLDA